MLNAIMLEKARRLCRHTVVFADHVDILAAVRAMQGRSTKAIANELDISESKAQYRIAKAQKTLGVYFRKDYRNGDGPIARKMLSATEGIAASIVREQIAPKYAPLSKRGRLVEAA